MSLRERSEPMDVRVSKWEALKAKRVELRRLCNDDAPETNMVFEQKLALATEIAALETDLGVMVPRNDEFAPSPFAPASNPLANTEIQRDALMLQLEAALARLRGFPENDAFVRNSERMLSRFRRVNGRRA